jgi:hypothetical protein
MIRYATLSALALLLAAPLAAQQRTTGGQELDWRGRIRSGGTMRIFNTNGAIRVEPGDGDEATVRSETRGSTAERERVILEVIEGNDGVTVCARRENQRCEEGGLRSEGRNWSERERVGTAALMVRLPRGVNLRASSGNGAVTVTRAGADVQATSGNGDVQVNGAAGTVRATSGNGSVTVNDAGRGVTASSGNGRVVISTAEGPVKASSGNGSVDVRMQSLRGAENMEFTSGNGRVTVRLPASFNGELDLSTGHGSAYSDFPVTVQGRLQPTRLRGTVGDGRGPTVRLRSGNGSVEVRKLDG